MTTFLQAQLAGKLTTEVLKALRDMQSFHWREYFRIFRRSEKALARREYDKHAVLKAAARVHLAAAKRFDDLFGEDDLPF
ncbi:MAG: hypothetical protein ABL934_03120 [Lysobacteraceae bacterium]